MLDAVGNVGIDIAHDCSNGSLRPLSHGLHASHNFAVETLLIEEPFTGDDELGIRDAIVEIEFVGHEFEAWQQATAQGHQRTGESARRTSVVMDRVLEDYYGGRTDAFWLRPATWPGRSSTHAQP